MRLLLIRHGETAHNAGQLALGREDVPLNERGLRQASAVAERLSRRSPIGRPAAIYSSPLQRALATAAPVATALGLEVHVEGGLIEMDVGEMEGLALSRVRELYPEFLREWLSDRVGDVSMPGGETLRLVQTRAWAVVEAIRDRHPEETVALVSHNFVILTLLCRTLDLPLGGFRRVRHDLGALSVLELTPQRTQLVTLNDRCHLEPLETDSLSS